MEAEGDGSRGDTGLLSLLIREGLPAKGVPLLTDWGEGEGIHGTESDRGMGTEASRGKAADAGLRTGLETQAWGQEIGERMAEKNTDGT